VLLECSLEVVVMSPLESDSDMCSFQIPLMHFAPMDFNAFVYIGRVKMTHLLLVKCTFVSPQLVVLLSLVRGRVFVLG
jgi:hypothetical protein